MSVLDASAFPDLEKVQPTAPRPPSRPPLRDALLTRQFIPANSVQKDLLPSAGWSGPSSRRSATLEAWSPAKNSLMMSAWLM